MNRHKEKVFLFYTNYGEKKPFKIVQGGKKMRCTANRVTGGRCERELGHPGLHCITEGLNGDIQEFSDDGANFPRYEDSSSHQRDEKQRIERRSRHGAPLVTVVAKYEDGTETTHDPDSLDPTNPVVRRAEREVTQERLRVERKITAEFRSKVGRLNNRIAELEAQIDRMHHQVDREEGVRRATEEALTQAEGLLRCWVTRETKELADDTVVLLSQIEKARGD